MLITIDDYKKYYEVQSGQDDLITNLLTVALEYIENILGYTLEVSSRYEKLECSPRIYLMCRPVISIESVKARNTEVPFEFIQGNSFIDIELEFCACGTAYSYLYITYTAGYTELPEFIKYMICSLVQSLLDSMEDESRKYTSYKINDIDYSFRDFASEKQDEIYKIITALR